MTNEMIVNIIAKARECSYNNRCTVFLMTNGNNVVYVRDYEERTSMENVGYWVAMIFEDGFDIEI